MLTKPWTGSGPKSVATLGFAAEFLMLDLPGPSADRRSGSGADKSRCGTAAERLAGITDRRRQLAAAFRIAGS
jgi:hypothetical protein